ncbi:MAG: hypothetical protein MUE32_06615 [Bacteroidales bacterium]|jgi:hypothetical protein|nr:hypothetical protein [Bacteroidales bacterium]
MKTLKKLLTSLVIFLLATACSEKEQWNPDAKGITVSPEVITIPFKAEFAAKFTTVSQDPMTCCGVGTGIGTCFKELKCNIMRCSNPLSGECQFTNDSYLYDKTGDKLYFSASARMLNPGTGDPVFLVQKWETEYVLNGGTGRFEGAMGTGKWSGYTTNRPGEENVAYSILSGQITVEKARIDNLQKK